MGLFPIKSGQIGQRSFYNPLSKVELRKHALEIWPGYIAAIERYDGGVYLVFDNSSKIIRNETVADIIATCLKNNPKEFRNEVTKAVLGKSVITRYTNKTYKIDEIDFEKTPEDSFQNADGSTVTFIDFYKVCIYTLVFSVCVTFLVLVSIMILSCTIITPLKLVQGQKGYKKVRTRCSFCFAFLKIFKIMKTTNFQKKIRIFRILFEIVQNVEILGFWEVSKKLFLF